MHLRNLITFQDILDLCFLVRRVRPGRVLSRFRFTRRGAVEATWGRTDLPDKNWTAIRAIRRHNNAAFTGESGVTAEEYVAKKYLGPLQPVTALSLGCGTGRKELALARCCEFKELLGVDMAARAVAAANESAVEAGKPELKFRAADVARMTLPKQHFDVVIALQALHHFSPVESVVRRIGTWLKPGGLLIIDEYIGPNRCQLTRAQSERANELLCTIPRRFRKRWRLDATKRKAHRPGLLRVILADPSECVESRRILPAIGKYFSTLKLVELGGTLLAPVFHDIGANFPDDDPEAQAIVDRCIAREQELLAAGEITSDFVAGVFQKKD